MNQVAHKVVPAIATNNRMVLKPSEKVPLSALLFADILYEAGLPPAMLSVLTGDPREIADELITNRTSTWSPLPAAWRSANTSPARPATGAWCWSWAATTRSSSWTTPTWTRPATLAVQGSYKNSGQRCTAVKRMLVHERSGDQFHRAGGAKTRAWNSVTRWTRPTTWAR